MKPYTRLIPTDVIPLDSKWQFPDIQDNGETKYGWCVLGKNFTLGYKTDIGWGTLILAHGGVRIEPYAQVGPNCSIVSYSTIDNKTGPVTIKENARIGGNTFIMPNVTIGKNAVIGAGSFINFNVPDNTTVIQKRTTEMK